MNNSANNPDQSTQPADGVKTDKLYYTDAYATVFSAQVLAIKPLERGQALILDRTYFYPTSGGQPFDMGTLAGAPVLDVIAEGGAVLHVVEAAPAVQVGDRVEGTIAWPRRYDHMQQHSGQHLLSQVFARMYEYETVSVHFGATESTLDLDSDAVTPEQVAAVERSANEFADQALPIKSYFVSDQDLARLPLRRAPKVSGQIRIVEIDAFDYSACGGTHVRTTAEIAPIKIVRQERRRGQTRITFLCGLRAYADYVEKHRLLLETAALFSNEASAVPSLVQRLMEQNKELQRQTDALTEQLLHYEVEELITQAMATTLAGKAVRIISQLYADRSVDALKQTATLLRAQPDVVALLATTAGGKLTLVFGRSDDVTLHAGNLLRDTLKAFGGGGGGRPEMAQGGGVEVGLGNKVLEYAREQINPSNG